MNDQQFTPVTLNIRHRPDGTCLCVNAMTNSPFFSLVFAHENLLRMAVDEWNATEGKSDPRRFSTFEIPSLPTPVPAAGIVRLPSAPDADIVITGVPELKKRYDIAVELNTQGAQKINELRAERDKLRSVLLHIKSKLNSMAGHRLMQVAGPARELLNYLKTHSL